MPAARIVFVFSPFACAISLLLIQHLDTAMEKERLSIEQQGREVFRM